MEIQGGAEQRTNNDLCTPELELELVRQLGPIVLDPCSNQWSKVGAVHTLDGSCVEQDGLLEPWFALAGRGLVFVNPPYGKGGHLGRWSEKIAHEAKLGGQIVALVPSSTGTVWWHRLADQADAICFRKGRISFDGGGHGGGKFDSAYVYFGQRRHLFADVFRDAGIVWVRS